MHASNLSRLKFIISMATFGTLAPFVRNISVSSAELALYRAILAFTVIGVYLLLTKQKIDLKAIGRDLLLLLICGMGMGFNWILLFEAYKYTTVSVATLSYYFAPVIVTVMCPILFREKITGKQALCFVMSTLGLMLVIGITDLERGGNDLIGICFGLGAAMLYAAVILINKYIKSVAGVHRTFLQFAAAALTLLPYVALTGGVTLHTMNTVSWVCMLTVGIVHSGVAYCLYFTGLQDITGQEAAILSYVDPLVAIVIGVAVLGEPLTWQQIIGGTLILGFTLWNEISTKNT